MRRAIAIDWSGAAGAAAARIWLAEAVEGAIVRVERPGGRERAIAALIAADAEPIVAGVDFAFSFPTWFLDRLAVPPGGDPWSQVAEQGEDWLATCPAPFWGRPGRRRGTEEQFRTCERSVRIAGIVPKSVFQIGGAGACGTGSIRGMPYLPRLRAAGWAIWPWDAPGPRTLVEIWPRTMSGPVVKSDPAARRAWMRRHAPDTPRRLRRIIEDGEDAFDAAVSALVLSRSPALDDLLADGPPGDPREGAMVVLPEGS